MIVQNNSQSSTSIRNMWQTRKEEEESQKKLASGKKINSAADDAAGLAVAEAMKAQISVASAAQLNTTSATSMVQTAEGAMGGMSSMLNRAASLATQASNGTYSDSDRAALQSEMDAIVGEISRVAASTNFNGQQLLNGEGSVDLQIGTDGEAYSTMSVDIGNLSDMAEALSNIDLTAVGGAADALETIGASLDFVSSERASLGATQNRLSYSANSLATYQENLQAAESRISDTDMAEEISKKKQKNIMFQANMAMMSKSNENASSVLNLLS